MNKSTKEIRNMFLDYFHYNDHKILPSSKLIPKNDSSLFFTNAGMNQFKDIISGNKKNRYNKIATAQECIRAGGKHNDLENVGYTKRHHTFFEMLGNFSFGGYFKLESIQYAWELLTSTKWFNIEKQKLFVTVHSLDSESYNIWRNNIGINDARILKVGDDHNILNSDNFWKMGDTGPCGTCTEIFYTNNSNVKCNKNTKFNDDFLEIWNIVFMQYYLDKDKIYPLKTYSVDTGMGLERIASVIQNVNSNYKIDIFRALTREITKIANITSEKTVHPTSPINVIADHIRSCFFIIINGILPSNEGRGYILRKIIRRASRHGSIIGLHRPFLWKLVNPLIKILDKKKFIPFRYKVENVIKNEEKQFCKILEHGKVLLLKEIRKSKNNTLSGKIVHKLYDTFGMPIDLTDTICKENNVQIDHAELKKLINKKYIIR